MSFTLPGAPAAGNAPADLSAFLDALLDLAAERIASKLAARASPDPSTRWASAKDNPLGSARAFLDAGRRGDFETFKRGREVVARWADVEAYIARRKCQRKPRSQETPQAPANANATAVPAAPTDADARRREQLVAAGVLPRRDGTSGETAPRVRRARGA